MIDSSQIKFLIRRHLLGEQDVTHGEVLHTRSNNRGGLLRLPIVSGKSIIVKIWLIRNLKERIKSAVHISNGWREWRMHQLIHRAGVSVPMPLGFYQFRLPNGQRYESMVIEDLGETEQGSTYLKKLVMAREELKVRAFEERLINITLQIVELGVVDIDHQLNNFLVDRNGRFVRTDFECARRPWLGRLPKAEFAEMVARLLTFHIFAVQPDVSRSEKFAGRLYERLNINSRLRVLVNDSVNRNLEYQRNESGIDTVVTLP